jgi:HK97 family phage major capsid protein
LEGVAFVRGNGTTEPAGWLTASDLVTVSGGTLDADDLIDLYHAVPSEFAANGTWLMNRANFGNARKLKATGTGNYLWTESLQPGDAPSLLGRPVVEIPDLVTSGSPQEIASGFGDWNQAFRIFDRVGLEILRDPYTLAKRSIVCFHARKRVGSALVRPDAVRALTVAA